jgi:inner membrane protein
MDPISQGVLGAIVTQATKSKTKSSVAGIFGFVAGMAADLDILIRSPTDPLLFLEYHRQITHSLVFVPIGGLVTGFFLFFIFGKRLNISFMESWLMCTIGYGTHGLLDACTTYGTAIFWPFTNDRIALSIISIIDPLFTIPAILFFILYVLKSSSIFAKLGFLWMISYLLLGAFNQQTAINLGHQIAVERGHTDIKVDAKPSFANIWVWKTLYEVDGRFYVDAVHTGFNRRVFQGQSIAKLDPRKDFPWLEPDSQQSQDIKRFQWFSMGYLAVDPKRKNRIGDIRFSVLPNEVSALWSIQLDPGAKADQHVDYVTHRDFGIDKRKKLWDMILSGWY